MLKSYNSHHIIPSSRGGSNNKINKVRLDIRHHQALHMLFANQTPTEQIARLLNINSTALTDQFKNDVNLILSCKEEGYVYER